MVLEDGRLRSLGVGCAINVPDMHYALGPSTGLVSRENGMNFSRTHLGFPCVVIVCAAWLLGRHMIMWVLYVWVEVNLGSQTSQTSLRSLDNRCL